MTDALFHLAVPVDDLSAARAFYGGTLGLREGRSSDTWIDFDFFGHQFVVHLGTPFVALATHDERNAVDGDAIPPFHYGVVLTIDDWDALIARLKDANIDFLLEPKTRFAGLAGEQRTAFIRDPAGNALEFKAFRDRSHLFATNLV